MKQIKSKGFKGWISLLTVTGLSLGLSLFLAEALLRLFVPQPILPMVYKPDSLLRYKLKEGFKGFQSSSEFKVSLNLNREGLRDYEHNIEKKSGSFRILALGDSFTLGHGVEMEDSYPKVLEKLLNGGTRDKSKYEVINTGVFGWEPTQEYLYLMNYGLRYKPDLIIWSLFVGNDFYETSCCGLIEISGEGSMPLKVNKDFNLATKALLEKVPGYNYLCQNSHLLSLFKRGIGRLLSIKDENNYQRFMHSLYSGTPLLKPRKALLLTKRLLKDSFGYAQSRGIGFLILIIPAYEQLHPDCCGTKNGWKDITYPNREIEKFCREEGIPSLDLFTDMSNAVIAGRSLYYAKDRHWNREGHKKAAELIYTNSGIFYSNER